jgi:hypothetical protein
MIAIVMNENPAVDSQNIVHSDELIRNVSTQIFPPPEFDANGEHIFQIQWGDKTLQRLYDKQEYESDLTRVGWQLTETGLSDEQLPEFVNLVSKISSRLNVDVWKRSSDVMSIITIAKNVEQATVLAELLDYWDSIHRSATDADFMSQVSHEDVYDVFKELSGAFISPERPLPSPELSKKILDIMLVFHGVRQHIPEGVSEVGVQSFRWGIEQALFDNHDPDSALALVRILREVASGNIDNHTFEQFAYSIDRYTRKQPLSEEAANNLRDHLLPAISVQDKNVQILQGSNNSWSMRRGEFAIGEYTCHLYTAEASPQFINELVLINSEVPTVQAHHFEQNRRDGSALTGIQGLGVLKEAIHDQRPRNHEVIQAMVDFYDGKIPPNELLDAAEKHDYISSEGEFVIVAVKREMYESMVEEKTANGQRDVKVIDVLRRLASNTAPIPDIPPETPSDTLNAALKSFNENENNQELRRPLLAKALAEANNLLINLYESHTVGVDSMLIQALGYLDRAAARELRGLSFEEQVRAYRADWFTEAFKFHELTSSADHYDQVAVDDFIATVQREHTIGAYEMLGKRVVMQVGQLGRDYAGRGFGRWSEMLWSGNLNHELISLIDLRVPATPEGHSYKKRFLSPEEDRLKGD